jgi:hypothetical protein
LYSLTALDGSMAISALARKVFFQFYRFCGRMLCLLAICSKVTVEKEWLAKKLKSLGLSNRKQLVELKLSSPHMPSSLLSVNQQCQLLSFCNNSSTNFVLNAEVYLVRFLLIFFTPIFLFSLTCSK